MKQICVNCGSSPGFDPCYVDMAGQLGKVIAEKGCDLIYGGAEVGLMGEVADSVLKGGGKVIGVIPKSFAEKVSHNSLTELHIVDSMHERKIMMFELSDGFIALPGGFGTLDEIMEILTWAQLGIHTKPIGLINVDRYFDQLLLFLDNAVSKGFIKEKHREMIIVSISPEDILKKMGSYQAPVIDKWIGLKAGK